MSHDEGRAKALVPVDPVDPVDSAESGQGGPQAMDRSLPARREPGALRRFFAACLPAKPTPLPRPQVAEDFESMGSLERVWESLRYNLLSLEYSLSPRGGLRQWFKLNLGLLLLVGLPVAILAPVAVYVLSKMETAGGHFERLTGHLFAGLENIFYSLLTLVAALVLVGSVIYLLRLAWVRMRGVDAGVAEVIEINPVRPGDRAGNASESGGGQGGDAEEGEAGGES